MPVPARGDDGASSFWEDSYFAIWLNDNPVGLANARETLFVKRLKNIDI